MREPDPFTLDCTNPSDIGGNHYDDEYFEVRAYDTVAQQTALNLALGRYLSIYVLRHRSSSAVAGLQCENRIHSIRGIIVIDTFELQAYMHRDSDALCGFMYATYAIL